MGYKDLKTEGIIKYFTLKSTKGIKPWIIMMTMRNQEEKSCENHLRKQTEDSGKQLYMTSKVVGGIKYVFKIVIVWIKFLLVVDMKSVKLHYLLVQCCLIICNILESLSNSASFSSILIFSPFLYITRLLKAVIH